MKLRLFGACIALCGAAMFGCGDDDVILGGDTGPDGGTDAATDAPGTDTATDTATDAPGTDAPGTDTATDAPGPDAGPAVCGDRVITAPETCDDGNTTPGDGCDAMCMREPSTTCGDGTVDRPVEECDDGNTTTGDGCDDACLVEASATCGDGMLDLADGEQCDDGGTLPGDGCSPTCQLETVGAFCGDDMMDVGEACDDGNVVNGDACNPTCNLTNDVTTFVGDGTRASTDGTGTAAQVHGGGALAVDDQYLWYGENGGCTPGSPVPGNLRRIEIATGVVTTITTFNACEAAGIATDGAGMIWVAGVDNGTTNAVIYAIDTTAGSPSATVVAGNAPCGGAGCYDDDAGSGATFGGIRGLTWWAGQLYIVDPAAGVIRRLDPSTNEVFNVAGDPFNNGIVDGTGAAARFQSPRYIVSDGSAMLYVSETNHGTIRAVNAVTGVVTTFAGNGTAGYVDAVGAAARSHRPRGITSDGTSLYWVEFNAHAIRQGILATREVSTLAGNVTTCSSPAMCSGGDTCANGVCLPPGGGPPVGGGYVDGVGTAAELFAPFSIAFHFPSRSLFVTDTVNNRIRRIQ